MNIGKGFVVDHIDAFPVVEWLRVIDEDDRVTGELVT